MLDISRAALPRAAGASTLGTAALGPATAAPGRREHPHVRLIRGYHTAYAAGDLDALRDRFSASGIEWTTIDRPARR
ncbi:hypothetical protein [Actinomadura rugatobispora]|uniref:Uncharacterized protein n=1 Tax=Actinomadura rugatobispora TaxID=1994 RepID=A0ABW0ZP67_9ACTN|nr:hypothetical protein GCM10010200_024150 [Actinomadura rugatobispora]